MDGKALLILISLLVLFLAALEDVRKMEVKDAYPLTLLFLSVMRAWVGQTALWPLVLNVSLVFAVLYLFWRNGGIGGADVKILTTLAIGEGVRIWVVLLVACVVFVLYSLALRKTRQELPFVPAIFVGALLSRFLDFGI